MREAKIILPEKGNELECIDKVHGALRKRLAKEFGGWTATRGYGGWVDDAGANVIEPVFVYVVACELVDGGKVEAIACEFARKAGQKAVYVRKPDGDVEIIDLEDDSDAD